MSVCSHLSGRLVRPIFVRAGRPADGKRNGGGASKAKERPPPEGALERSLDRQYAADAHGSRFLYVVRLYEDWLVSREAKLATELRATRDRAAADIDSTHEHEAELSKGWDAERAAHAEALRASGALLEAERQARHEEVALMRESAESAASKALEMERRACAEVAARLRATEAELMQASERLRKTEEELQAIARDREEKVACRRRGSGARTQLGA